MNLPQAYRSFEDLYNRIIVEEYDSTYSGGKPAGNALQSFGQSYANRMRDAYNLTANKIGLGIKSDTQNNPLYSQFFEKNQINPEHQQVLNIVENKYKTDQIFFDELKTKQLKLKSGGVVTFNILNWSADVGKLTYKSLKINNNDAFLRNTNEFKNFCISFLITDMNRPTSDITFDNALNDSIKEFLDAKYGNSTTKLSSGATTPPTTPPVVDPIIDAKIKAETPKLKTDILQKLHNIKAPNRKAKYTDIDVYYKVFYTFISNPKGSLLF